MTVVRPGTRSRGASELVAWLVLLAGIPCVAVQTASAQDQQYMSAMELEQEGKFREAAAAYRGAIGKHGASALLGLERVYAEMGLSDSLLPILDSVIAAEPREALYRSMLLRTHRFAGRTDDMRTAFERWTKDAPGEAAPYREYSRLLLQDGRAAEADTVLQRAQRALGSTRDLETEMAQLRAATGQWELSTQSWRAAVRGAPYLEQAAVFALSPAPEPTRVAVRRVLNAPPIEISARRLLAALELGWGSPRDAWQALRTVPPDSIAAGAWRDFGERAENAGAWLTARDAFAAVHAWRPSASAAVRAGYAALNGNNPESALELATIAESLEDSSQAAQSSVPLRVRALTLLAKPAEAEAAVAAYEEWLPADVRLSLLRSVALGWVRAGDVTKARTALATAGTEDDDPAAGWIALYEGDLTTARRVMRASSDLAPGGVTALAILARTRAPRSGILGRAFLALARGDSAQAARELVEAADSLPDAASLLLATAAHIDAARRNDAGAVALWSTILERHSDTPEAAEADLLWARLLRRNGDAAAAIARLEHLILNYPASALVPQARRELELARGGIPSTS